MADFDYLAFGLRRIDCVTSTEYRGSAAQLVAAGIATAQQMLDVVEFGAAVSQYDARGDLIPKGCDAIVMKTVRRSGRHFSVQVHFDLAQMQALRRSLQAARAARADGRFQSWLVNVGAL